VRAFSDPPDIASDLDSYPSRIASSISQTRSQAAMRQSLHLHIDPSSYTTPKVDISTRIPSPAFSANMSTRNEVDNYNSYSGASDIPLFSVLCKYDFSSDEDGLLPFRKGEILEVVKRDNTGWWAAMRKEGPIVGWIPQAFVVQLSPDMVDKLRNTRRECRIYEYDAEQLYNSAPVSRTPALFDTDSAMSSPLPEYEAYRVSIMPYPKFLSLNVSC
jgi:son of sevenless-like protein